MRLTAEVERLPWVVCRHCHWQVFMFGFRPRCVPKGDQTPCLVGLHVIRVGGMEISSMGTQSSCRHNPRRSALFLVLQIQVCIVYNCSCSKCTRGSERRRGHVAVVHCMQWRCGLLGRFAQEQEVQTGGDTYRARDKLTDPTKPVLHERCGERFPDQSA
jgi:hypothetical protein